MSQCRVYYQPGPLIRLGRRRYRRCGVFVAALGYSGAVVRLMTWRPTPQIWTDLHERAFRDFGGVPRVILLDALATGPLAPRVYHPVANPRYREVLRYYGALAVPPRPPNVRRDDVLLRTAWTRDLQKLRYESLADAQAGAGIVAASDPRRLAEERLLLRPLPSDPAPPYAYARRKVHLDGTVEIAGAFYEAPAASIGRSIVARWDTRQVQLIAPATGELLREHPRLRPGRYSPRSGTPTEAVPKTTTALLVGSAKSGSHVATLCAQIHRREGESGVRAILGVLALARRHGPRAVDRACEEALRRGTTTYRSVRDLVRTVG